MMKTYHFKIKISVDGRERWADGDKLFAHLMKDYNKTLLKGKENMDKRLKKFKLDVLQSDCTEKYDYKLLEEFIEYWTEPNKSGTKMRFELEKTWSLSRRLKKWKRNGFGKKQQTIADFKLDATGNAYMGFCEKCGVSDFYRKEELRGDSHCHNATLLPTKP